MLEKILLEAHYNLIPFQLYISDVNTYELLFVNDLLASAHGNLAGRLCHEALHGQSEPCEFCPIKDIVTDERKPNGRWQEFEYFNEVEDCWYQVKSRALGWTDGTIVQQSVRVDITKLKEAQSQLAEAHATMALQNKDLKHISATDRLTGIANRLCLDEVLEMERQRAIRCKCPLSAIILDIDKFKLVNDTYGHQAGDVVLRQLADILVDGVRKTDTPGRWGGEEFLIIMPGASLPDAEHMAERLRKDIEAATFPEVGTLTASFGVARLDGEETTEALVKRADAALYKAKESGRNRVVCG